MPHIDLLLAAELLVVLLLVATIDATSPQEGAAEPVRVPRRLHEHGQCPLRHLSLDASVDGEPCLLDQLAAPEPEPAISEAIHGLALEQLVEQLPAAEATALRLTVLEGLSLRAAAERLEISAMSVSHREVRFAAQRAQKKAIGALRLQLEGGG